MENSLEHAVQEQIDVLGTGVEENKAGAHLSMS